MKRISCSVALLSVCPLLVACGGRETAGEVPDSLLYMGEPPPGGTPVAFASERISQDGYRLHGSPVFRPDQREVVWAVIPPAVMSIALDDGKWTEATPLAIPGRGVQAPAFSPDGRRFYYQAVMDGGEGGLDLWWLDRGPGGWGPPINPGRPLNSPGLESQPTVTREGTVYFTGQLEGSGMGRGIYRSRLGDGVFSEPELLDEEINSPFIDYCPWIAPDESYLLFASSRPESEEVLHLHVSFRREDGSWSEAVNIHGALGFSAPARFPTVSPDGRFLFFLSGDVVYWVEMTPVLALRDSVISSIPSSGSRGLP